MLAAHGLGPKKSLGQNFLIEPAHVRRLVEAAEIRAGDLVLEVGPGTGVLTEALAHAGAEVVAVEFDDGLAGLVRQRAASEWSDRVRVINADCLAGKRAIAPVVTESLAGRRFKLVANLPYNAATPLMMTLLVQHPECAGLFVTVQKEVADRLGASPGSKAYGAISVVAQCMATVEQLATLPPGCFWPRPGIDSAMVAIRRREQPLTDGAASLAAFCQEVFSARRKQLGPTLRRLGREPENWPEGVRPTDRIEGLAPMVIAGLERATRPR